MFPQKHVKKLTQLHKLRQTRELAAQAQVAVAANLLRATQQHLRLKELNHISLQSDQSARKSFHLEEALKRNTLASQLGCYIGGCLEDQWKLAEATTELRALQAEEGQAHESKLQAIAQHASRVKERRISESLLRKVKNVVKTNEGRGKDDDQRHLCRPKGE